MKVLSFLATCGLLALTLPRADAVSGKGKPGYCNNNDDCTKKAKDYTCVSVQTTRDNVEFVKQCLPTASGTPVCTGVNPGLCPSFSTTWGEEFRQISSVCAYIYPDNKKAKCIESGSNSTKGAVECLFINDPDEGKSVGVIYGCVDFDGSRLLFDKKDKSDKLASQFNYTDIIAESCVNPKNPKGASFVCSSQGTCGPKVAGKMEYECKCNVGFSGTYCEKIDDNKCYHDGVCGGGSCDLDKQECTKCPAGTKGNKCAECDPTYATPCNGHGKCVASSGDSTLGVANSGSGSSSSSSAKKTPAPAESSAEGSAEVETEAGAGEVHAASGSTAAASGSGTTASSGSSASTSTRFLAATGSAYQCKCDDGYSDFHCNVKIPKSKKSGSSSTDSSSVVPTPSSASVLSVSISAAALTLAATLTL